MKKVGVLIWLCTFVIAGVFLYFRPHQANATSGCCSWHGGVSGCSSGGRSVCGDGTLSPSCTCSSPTKNYGSSSSLSSAMCKDELSQSYKELQTSFDQNVTTLKDRDSEIVKLNKTIDDLNDTVYYLVNRTFWQRLWNK